jgi:GDPmannose 4,6-dehydratase
VDKAFANVGTRIEWRGAGVDEKGFDAASGRLLVEIDPRYFRPAEVDVLIGDATKARTKLGWRHTISFDELVGEMVEADLESLKREHGPDLATAELVGTRKPRRTRAAH